jgi:predicted nuclease of restriction endonuclease-like (RecB) superfamily
VEILPLKDEIQREFYLTLAATQRWGRDELRGKIDGMLFERTEISGKPDEFIRKELSAVQVGHPMNPDFVFKDPYFLDFTGLKGFYSERDLESRGSTLPVPRSPFPVPSASSTLLHGQTSPACGGILV